MRILTLRTIDKPQFVIALQFARPVFVFNMIYAVRSDHNTIIFKELHCAVYLGRIFSVRDDIIIRWKFGHQIIVKLLFSGLLGSIALDWFI